jgi:hypothetical protein
MLESLGNRFQYTFSIGHDFVIVETKNAIAFACKKRTSLLVILYPFRLEVLSSIKLNDEHGLMTDEVYDERTDRGLSTKTNPIQPVGPKRGPYYVFCIR